MTRARLPIIYSLSLVLAASAGWEFHHIAHSTNESTTMPGISSAEADSPVIPVQTIPLKRSSIEESTQVYGVVQNQSSGGILISLPAETIVKSVFVAVGQSVEATTPLAVVMPSPDELMQMRRADDAAKAARLNFDEVQKRLASQLATNADAATAQQALQTAQLELENLTKRGIEADHVLTSVSPGIVTGVTAQPGQMFAAGAPLLTITPRGGREIRLGVPPMLGDTIRTGAAVDIESIDSVVDASPICATVRLVPGQINPQSRLRDVLLSIPKDAELLDGDFVTGQIVTAHAEGLLVPRSAAHFDDGNWVVFTVKDDKAVKHVVTLGLSNRTETQIVADDLREGDAVISQANGDLDDATPVEVKVAQAKPDAASTQALGPAKGSAPEGTR